MRRSLIIAGLAVGLLSSSALARSQDSALIGIVFYTMPANERPGTPTGRAFVQGLREKGWVEGRNARIVWRSADGQLERIPQLIEELLRMPLDVLVVSGNDFAAESVKRSPTLPVVMASADFPVESGLVASLAFPGGSITGISNWVGRTLNGKRLAILKEAVPAVTRVAVLGFLSGMSSARFSPETESAARSLGVSMVRIGADRIEDLEPAFESAVRAGAQAIFVADYPLAFAQPAQVRLGELAIKYRLPAIHSASTAADHGALLTYGPDISENFRRAGHLVDKILRGARPRDIPFEEPGRVELIVNLRAAEAIGLIIPPSVVLQASRTIN